jgi:hypothetical protein
VEIVLHNEAVVDLPVTSLANRGIRGGQAAKNFRDAFAETDLFVYGTPGNRLRQLHNFFSFNAQLHLDVGALAVRNYRLTEGNMSIPSTKPGRGAFEGK